VKASTLALLLSTVAACNAANSAVPDGAAESRLRPDGAPPGTSDAGAPPGTSDAGAPDTTLDAGAPADAADAAAPAPDLAARPDLAPAIAPAAFCPVPSMNQIYSGFLPPNPYGSTTPSDACIASYHDAIIVLGCPNNDDGTPSSCQTKRADIAVALEAAGYGNRYIPSGAAVHNAYVEADTLTSLLEARGVDASRIFPDRQANHTDENIYYSTKIMEAHGWVSAWVVSEDPGQLVMTAICDSNCCVDLGRLTVIDLPLGSGITKVGHYVRYPWADSVSSSECQTIEFPLKAMCTNLSSRLACADNFKL
jgi:hypothetical protein